MTNHTKAQLLEKVEEWRTQNAGMYKANDIIEFMLVCFDELLASKKAAIEEKLNERTVFVPMADPMYEKGFHAGKIIGLSTAVEILEA
jgi:hypothetical protein